MEMRVRTLFTLWSVGFVLYFSSINIVLCQRAPIVKWQHCYGGLSPESSFFTWSGGITTVLASDGGFAFAGEATGNGGDVSGFHGIRDIWVVRCRRDGSIRWQRCLGSSGDEIPTSICPLADSGFAVTGFFDTPDGNNDGDVTGNSYGNNAWLVRLDSDGAIVWQRCFGGSPLYYKGAWANSVIEATDGSLVVAGSEKITEEGLTNHGSSDAYIVSFSKNGGIQWQKNYGGSGGDGANSIVELPDGSFVFAGTTNSSNDGDVTGHHLADSAASDGNSDIWLVHIDHYGNLLHERCIGGTLWEDTPRLIRTQDNGFAILSRSISTDYDLSGVRDTGKYWLLKLDSNLNIEWQSRFGGNGALDYPCGLLQTKSGDLVISGATNSTNGDVHGIHGRVLLPNGTDSTTDIWIADVSIKGVLQWQKCLGGSDNDGGGQVAEMQDSSLTVVGSTLSNDGDVSGNHGGGDVWVVQLHAGDSLAAVTNTNSIWIRPSDYQFKIYPNPAQTQVTLELHELQQADGVIIYDILGRRLKAAFHCIANRVVVDAGELPTGEYIAEVAYHYNSYSGVYSLPIIIDR